MLSNEMKSVIYSIKRKVNCLFIIRPTNARMWHNAIFKVGPVAGPKPTRVRRGQKYLQLRRHSPFWGRLRRQAMNSRPKGVKAWGDGPLSMEELSSAEAHPAEPPRDTKPNRMQPNNWRVKIRRSLRKVNCKLPSTVTIYL